MTASSMRASIDGSGLSRLEAELLLAHALGCSRAGLLARAPERAIEPAPARAFDALVARRRAGEPIAYLLGRREFWSLDLEVTPDTLIPRPETEHVVEAVLEAVAPDARAAIADLGTGSGAIAIAIAVERPHARVVATDASDAALAVAARNAARLAPGRVELRRGDWCAALGEERFDVIASNPPYVADDDPHLARGDAAHEPRAALAAGPRGLDAIARIAAGARERLNPGARLVLEHGFEQGPAVRELLAADRYASIATRPDLAGHERVTVAARGG